MFFLDFVKSYSDLVKLNLIFFVRLGFRVNCLGVNRIGQARSPSQFSVQPYQHPGRRHVRSGEGTLPAGTCLVKIPAAARTSYIKIISAVTCQISVLFLTPARKAVVCGRFLENLCLFSSLFLFFFCFQIDSASASF